MSEAILGKSGGTKEKSMWTLWRTNSLKSLGVVGAVFKLDGTEKNSIPTSEAGGCSCRKPVCKSLEICS